MATLILLNKPFQVLSQFTDREPGGARTPVGARSAGDGPGSPGGPGFPGCGTRGAARATLADYLQAPGFRVAGRLDYDSEGLLLLTDDGQLQQQIANPRHKLWKTYWVQIEGVADDAALSSLEGGVELKDGRTLPARVRRIPEPEGLWARDPPVRRRLTVADSWLELSIREGRNRQIRRMTAAVNLPTLRLIRYRVGNWTLQGLAPGEHKRLVVHGTLPRTGLSKHKPAPRPRRKK